MKQIRKSFWYEKAFTPIKASILDQNFKQHQEKIQANFKNLEYLKQSKIKKVSDSLNVSQKFFEMARRDRLNSQWKL